MKIAFTRLSHLIRVWSRKILFNGLGQAKLIIRLPLRARVRKNIPHLLFLFSKNRIYDFLRRNAHAILSYTIINQMNGAVVKTESFTAIFSCHLNRLRWIWYRMWIIKFFYLITGHICYEECKDELMCHNTSSDCEVQYTSLSFSLLKVRNFSWIY